MKWQWRATPILSFDDALVQEVMRPLVFAQAVRQHWGIENSLHWVLDVSFDEDACRIRKDQGAQTFSVLRHIALNLLRRESSHKRGMKARRKRAGWDREYLLQVLTG